MGWTETRGLRTLCCIALALMLCVDSVFVGVSAIQSLQETQKDRWHVSFEGGFAERWQYVKWAGIALMLGATAIRRRSAVYLAWMTVFTYLFYDDSSQVHERYGLWLAQSLEFKPAFGLNPADFGEVIVTAVAATVLLASLAIAYGTSSQQDARLFTRRMLVLLAALAFFGVGVDLLDIALPWKSLRLIGELIEDGGEMVVASVMAAFVLYNTFEVPGSLRSS